MGCFRGNTRIYAQGRNKRGGKQIEIFEESAKIKRLMKKSFVPGLTGPSSTGGPILNLSTQKPERIWRLAEKRGEIEGGKSELTGWRVPRDPFVGGGNHRATRGAVKI